MALGLHRSRSGYEAGGWIRPAVLADPGSSRLPLGTWLFAVLLFAAVGAQIMWSNLGLRPLAQDFGLRSDLWSWSDPAGYSRIVSYALFHSSTQHFAWNAVLVLLVGSVIEWRIGIRAIAALVLLGAIGGGLTHLLLFPAEARPLIGASGVVSGFLGAALIVAGGVGIRIRVPFSSFWLSLTLRRVMVFWLALQLFGLSTVYVLPSSSVSVAYWAHLAGFGVGVAAGLVSTQFGWARERTVLDPALASAGD